MRSIDDPTAYSHRQIRSSPTSTTSARVRLRRTASALTVLAIAATGVQMGHESAALADTADVICLLGQRTQTFSPGITFTPQMVGFTVEADLGTCTSSDPSITTGSFSGAGQGTFSCLPGNTTSSATTVVTWNTTETSTMVTSSTVSVDALGVRTVTTSGTVVGGKFVGDRVDSVSTLTPDNPLCCTSPSGLASVSGPLQLIYTDL